jgi:hypothetical protein
MSMENKLKDYSHVRPKTFFDSIWIDTKGVIFKVTYFGINGQKMEERVLKM